jgi:hypothetical protein
MEALCTGQVEVVEELRAVHLLLEMEELEGVEEGQMGLDRLAPEAGLRLILDQMEAQDQITLAEMAEQTLVAEEEPWVFPSKQVAKAVLGLLFCATLAHNVEQAEQ